VFVRDGAPSKIGKNNGAAAKLKKRKNTREQLLSSVSTVFIINIICVQKVLK
jgi:hypothetical protein